LAVFKQNPDKIWLFQSERLGSGSGKTFSELNIHYKSFLTRVYHRAGILQRFYCSPKNIQMYLIKQMYDSVITGKENVSID